MLALLAAFVTGCAADEEDASGSAAPADARVRYPGEVLFVREERERTLAAVPETLRRAWCAAGSAAAVGTVPPVARLRALASGPDTASEPFAHAVMTLDAAAFGTDDAAARRKLVELLDLWARSDALARLQKASANTYYALDRTLLPTLVAFALVRDEPGVEPEARERIERWLARLQGIRGSSRVPPPPGDATARNNHYYLRASVDMAWGALTGDDAAFREGSVAYLTALRDMRPDGSLPLETRRGARALWYQRHALASLVVIAEMAATQGVDLYGREVDGKTLHLAVDFLLHAIAEPERLRPHVEAGELEQDLGFLERRGHGRHYMAWAEIYMARFPERPESARLLDLLTRVDPDFRPMVDDYSGGNTTCFFALPADRAEAAAAVEVR
jgi:poly(beta-D-mannuronate) lyase